MTVLLFDMDILPYECAFGAQDKEGNPTMSEAKCISLVDKRIESTLRATKCDELVGILSGPSNFRYKVAKTKPYKGNRVDMVKPYYFDDVKHYIEEHYNPVITDGIEADDELRIRSIDLTEANQECVIASLDKDLLQAVGTHYNWRKDEFTEVSEDFSNYWFWAQCLIGDTADNIPGAKGYGIKKSHRLLKNAKPEERKRIVREIHNDDEFLTEIGNLLHILRHYDDCFDLEEW